MAHNVQVDSARVDGVTPLMIAVAFRHYEVLHLLLDLGANPNAFRNDGVTRLLFACHEGFTEAVRLLLAYKADPTMLYGTHSPLSIALIRGHIEVVRLLIAHGVPFNPDVLRANVHLCGYPDISDLLMDRQLRQ